jgi:hypothetical protein
VLASLQTQPLASSHMPRVRCVLLPPGSEYVTRQHCEMHNPQEPNSAICNLYLLGDRPCAGASAAASRPLPALDACAQELDDEALLTLLAHIVCQFFLYYFLNTRH